MAVDRNVIENLREFQEEGEPDFLKELFELFVTKTPSAIALSEKALEQGDLRSAGRVLTPLRAHSGTLGARRLMTLCTEAELLSQQSKASAPLLSDLLEKIKQEYAEVERELRLILFS
jgi:HPt (histidine-containing phosphotransfer) domain-containing protein